MPLFARSFLILLAAGVLPMLASSSVSALADLPTETVESFTLDNGLSVVVIPDTRVPVVTHMIWYKVGSADEERGKSGIAHFLEHLMFKGTKAYATGVFSKAVAAWGGQENAFTSTDYTSYYQRIAREKLSEAMTFEADRMTGLVLTDELVNPEREVVLEERRMRTDNQPGALLGEQVNAALFLNHPYGVPIIGWEHEIKKLNRTDALAFYKRNYAPNNAILVIAGDVTTAEVKTLAQATYGKVPAGPDMKPRERPSEPPAIAERRVTYADKRVAQPSFSRHYLAPSYRTGTKGQGEALDILSQIIGGGANSRLFKALVTDQGIAAGAGAYYTGTTMDLTRFVVYATPRPNVTLAQVEEATDKVLAELIANGVTEQELARAKTGLIADSVYSRDSQQSMARMYGAGLAIGESIDDIRLWPQRIAAITADQVKAVAVEIFDRRRSVTGLLVKDATP